MSAETSARAVSQNTYTREECHCHTVRRACGMEDDVGGIFGQRNPRHSSPMAFLPVPNLTAAFSRVGSHLPWTAISTPMALTLFYTPVAPQSAADLELMYPESFTWISQGVSNSVSPKQSFLAPHRVYFFSCTPQCDGSTT